jgi:hypothetical protein
LVRLADELQDLGTPGNAILQRSISADDPSLTAE